MPAHLKADLGCLVVKTLHDAQLFSWQKIASASTFSKTTARSSNERQRKVRVQTSFLVFCRNQAYAARGYSQPPSIENAANHPFLKDLEAKENGGSQAAEETSQAGAAQPSTAAKPPAVASRPLQLPASTAKAAPAAAPQPAQLFDLLSLHDVSFLRSLAPQRFARPVHA